MNDLALASFMAPQQGGSATLVFMVQMVAIFAIFYFLLIRPERKKQKNREAMIKTMKKGDRVMTTSGMYGNVAQVQDDVVTLQVADGVRLRFNRAAIQAVLEPEAKDKASEKDAPAAD